MSINIPLSDYEIEMLNKIVHTQAFVDYHNLQNALHNLINDDRQSLIANGKAYEQDFGFFQAQTIKHITDFLKHNEFYAEREGSVFFLTEKGNQLKTQGSLQKYLEWQMQRDAQIMADLHTIETKGYLDKDQTFSHEPKPVDKEYNTKILWYIIILLAIFLLWWYGKKYI